ncbi:isochorismatase family protein, partial [Rhizobium leguminosarum]|uniref:isochorismatase family protein n=1 Tax=Rhizobium leguminosarum TaxID=384 RepID=UPI003F9CD870
IDRQQALIDGAQADGIPIIQIFHVDENGPFSEASGFVSKLAPLRIAPKATFRKRRHSALVGSCLDVWLTENGVRRILVSGIRT